MHHSVPPCIAVRSSTGALIELPVRSDIADVLYSSISAAALDVEVPRLGDLCAQDLVGLLRVLEDNDARPPTTAQLKFGLDISRRLGVDLPIGAIQDRGIMGRFLTRYAASMRPQQKSPSVVPDPALTAKAGRSKAPRKTEHRRRKAKDKGPSSTDE